MVCFALHIRDFAESLYETKMTSRASRGRSSVFPKCYVKRGHNELERTVRFDCDKLENIRVGKARVL